jgi:hypothetical protein
MLETILQKVPSYQQPYSPLSYCIASHIRMGDRHLVSNPSDPFSNNIDMLQWCHQHTNYTKKKSKNYQRTKIKVVDIVIFSDDHKWLLK